MNNQYHQDLIITPVANHKIIHLEHISKVYGIGTTEVNALNDVSLIVETCEYCSIMGPSGSGKSTAMNIIGCLDRPTSGNYYLDNVDVAQIDDGKLAHIRNQKVGTTTARMNVL